MVTLDKIACLYQVDFVLRKGSEEDIRRRIYMFNGLPICAEYPGRDKKYDGGFLFPAISNAEDFRENILGNEFVLEAKEPVALFNFKAEIFP